MSLTDALMEGPGHEQVARTRVPRAITAAFKTLEGAAAERLWELLVSETGAPSDWLALILTENGFEISGTTIRVYRRALARERRIHGSNTPPWA